ncbi:MAG: hypothetical protein IPK91_08030 [Saprospiraceae bacterium]|nr:hypothetical protein [Saprospiraceae bacterium]MBK8297210.1 hypothetical protein [Saprospiraceae bacterium]
MRFILPFLLASIFVGHLVANTNFQDSSYAIKIKYSKKDLKKEMQDVKNLDKQIKEWNKAIKSNNPDYMNSLFSKTLVSIQKEHSELSNRVSSRSKALMPPTTVSSEDQPKVYNPELKDQINRVNKADIMAKKVESEYLSNYITVVKNEKNILTKLASIASFDEDTKPEIYPQIAADFIAFKSEMKAEIELMKKETGKK